MVVKTQRENPGRLELHPFGGWVDKQLGKSVADKWGGLSAADFEEEGREIERKRRLAAEEAERMRNCRDHLIIDSLNLRLPEEAMLLEGWVMDVQQLRVDGYGNNKPAFMPDYSYGSSSNRQHFKMTPLGPKRVIPNTEQMRKEKAMLKQGQKVIYRNNVSNTGSSKLELSYHPHAVHEDFDRNTELQLRKQREEVERILFAKLKDDRAWKHRKSQLPDFKTVSKPKGVSDTLKSKTHIDSENAADTHAEEVRRQAQEGWNPMKDGDRLQKKKEKREKFKGKSLASMAPNKARRKDIRRRSGGGWMSDDENQKAAIDVDDINLREPEKGAQADEGSANDDVGDEGIDIDNSPAARKRPAPIVTQDENVDNTEMIKTKEAEDPLWQDSVEASGLDEFSSLKWDQRKRRMSLVAADMAAAKQLRWEAAAEREKFVRFEQEKLGKSLASDFLSFRQDRKDKKLTATYKVESETLKEPRESPKSPKHSKIDPRAIHKITEKGSVLEKHGNKDGHVEAITLAAGPAYNPNLSMQSLNTQFTDNSMMLPPLSGGSKDNSLIMPQNGAPANMLMNNSSMQLAINNSVLSLPNGQYSGPPLKIVRPLSAIRPETMAVASLEEQRTRRHTRSLSPDRSKYCQVMNKESENDIHYIREAVREKDWADRFMGPDTDNWDKRKTGAMNSRHKRDFGPTKVTFPTNLEKVDHDPMFHNGALINNSEFVVNRPDKIVKNYVNEVLPHDEVYDLAVPAQEKAFGPHFVEESVRNVFPSDVARGRAVQQETPRDGHHAHDPFSKSKPIYKDMDQMPNTSMLKSLHPKKIYLLEKMLIMIENKDVVREERCASRKRKREMDAKQFDEEYRRNENENYIVEGAAIENIDTETAGHPVNYIYAGGNKTNSVARETMEKLRLMNQENEDLIAEAKKTLFQNTRVITLPVDDPNSQHGTGMSALNSQSKQGQSMSMQQQSLQQQSSLTHSQANTQWAMNLNDQLSISQDHNNQSQEMSNSKEMSLQLSEGKYHNPNLNKQTEGQHNFQGHSQSLQGGVSGGQSTLNKNIDDFDQILALEELPAEIQEQVRSMIP